MMNLPAAICLFPLVFSALAVPFRASADSFELDSLERESSGEPAVGIGSDRAVNLALSSLPGVKIGFVQGFTFPFLRGGSVLTADNNFRTTLTAEVSPVSANGIVEGILTPIAFLQVAAGFRIGTGWNITLFGSDLYGIGINRSGAGGKAETTGSAFDGVQWKAHFGGALQFDMAAVFPGDWNHVVFRSYHEINYKGYSAASKSDSWFFENDGGENRNGFNYYGNFLAGYQMPFFFNMAAVLVEMDKFLYDTPGRDSWGDDLVRWTFSAVFNFTVTDRIGAVLIPQWRTVRNYTGSDSDTFYQNRSLDRAHPLRFEFYRVAAILTFKLP
ncbi:MAG: hypothetical protein LBK83_12615 [Treponema sp.]|jgi:hypothetical protein|nr:hypothetical protein [Treponema sp.]